jgi:putative sterol carrier protein
MKGGAVAQARKKPAGKPHPLEPLAERLSKSGKMREGAIALRFNDGGATVLHAARGKVEVRDAPASDEPPLIEVFGDRTRIEAIINGEKDPRKIFLAGGLRVRGDLRYLSELAVDLGLLDEPF